MGEQKSLFEIQMLGAFRVTWQGEEIAVASNAAPRFLQLMQEVWLAGDVGVTREQLLRDLYEGRPLQNPCNSINNLILQARKHLSGAGLPPAGYIAHQKNLYWPDPAIPTVCDASSFHAWIQKARAAAEREKHDTWRQQGTAPSTADSVGAPVKSVKSEETDSLLNNNPSGQLKERSVAGREVSFDVPSDAEQFYREAVSLYSGRFLPQESGFPWIEREAGRLVKEYREAVDFLVRCAVARGGRKEAEQLIESARSVDPESEWSGGLLRRPRLGGGVVPELSGEGEGFGTYRAARNADGAASDADKTAMGTDGLAMGTGRDVDPRSQLSFTMSGMEEMLPQGQGNMAASAAYPVLEADLSDISSRIGLAGACCCSQESFRDIVNVVGSNLERTGCSAFLMLLELVDYKGKRIANEGKRRARMASLRAVIEQNLRSGDAVTRIGDSSYLILMVGYNEEERARVLRRIRTDLRRREGGKARVKNSGFTLSELR